MVKTLKNMYKRVKYHILKKESIIGGVWEGLISPASGWVYKLETLIRTVCVISQEALIKNLRILTFVS